tara:strand:+ start:4983 stop:6215 length:1233 start_codon:yes stop_codon:yes gene_type:complete
MNNKLQGKTELSRIHELMGSVGGSSKSKNPKIIKESFAANGKNYAVVKENAQYIIKESINGNFEYINGLRNKTDFTYRSYSEALKQLNFMHGSLNEAYNSRGGVNLFEDKRFVLKRPKMEQASPEVDVEIDVPATPPTGAAPAGVIPPAVPGGATPPAPGPPAPEEIDAMITKAGGTPPAPGGATPPAPGGATPPVRGRGPKKPTMPKPPTGPPTPGGPPAPNAGGVDFDAEVSSIERELGGGEETPEKEIQSLTGKLGQALRQGEAEQVVDTELTKYVVNSVFSALNIGELTDEDKLEIIKKVKNAGTEQEIPGTPDMPGMGGGPNTPQIGMPGGHPEEEDDTEMEIDGLDSGMDDEELDIDIDDFEDMGMEEDMLYGDGDSETSDTDDITMSLRKFVQNTVDSYIGQK